MSCSFYEEVQRLFPQYCKLALDLHDSFVEYVAQRVNRLSIVNFDLERNSDSCEESSTLSENLSTLINPNIPKLFVTIVERLIAVKAHLESGVFRLSGSAELRKIYSERFRKVRVHVCCVIG